MNKIYVSIILLCLSIILVGCAANLVGQAYETANNRVSSHGEKYEIENNKVSSHGESDNRKGNKGLNNKCQEDSDCKEAAKPYCDTRFGICRPCTADEHCSAQVDGEISCSNRLNENQCTCVFGEGCRISVHVCQNDGDCLGNRVCDPETRTCVECLSDNECTNPFLPACYQKECTQCTRDNHCTQYRPYCLQQESDHRCVECYHNEHCPSDSPICKEGSNRCIECNSDDDCSLPNPVCDLRFNSCRECRTDNHCTDTLKPACNTRTFSCIECVTNEHCSNEEEPICNTRINRCTECLEDQDCNVDTPFCSYERCYECKEDSDCPNTKSCFMGTCDGCSSNEDCLNPEKPYCFSAECFECLRNEHCPENFFCQSGLCIESEIDCRECCNDEAKGRRTIESRIETIITDSPRACYCGWEREWEEDEAMEYCQSLHNYLDCPLLTREIHSIEQTQEGIRCHATCNNILGEIVESSAVSITFPSTARDREVIFCPNGPLPSE